MAVGFQHLSAFRLEEQRYRQIAAAGTRIWVCAVVDEAPPEIEGITFAPVNPEWPVADEWFVVVNAPGFASALLATEVSNGFRSKDRSFQTMFTSDPRLVNAICRSLAIELDLHMEIPATRDPEAQQINLRRFNRLALEYQERQMLRHTTPIAIAPSWAPSLTPGRYFGERELGGTE
jgi:DICT domain-containing protein